MSLAFRPAQPQDARALAELYSFAAGGLAEYMWSLGQDAAVDPLDVGETWFAQEEGHSSYRHCTIAEIDSAVQGMAQAMPLTEQPESFSEGDPVLAPFDGFGRAPSLYIDALACYPAARGRGVGSALLELMADDARDIGLPQLSLIVYEQNTDAVRLYERYGFQVAERRAIVEHKLIRYTGDYLLMVARV